jgi:hypothetical protein
MSHPDQPLISFSCNIWVSPPWADIKMISL